MMAALTSLIKPVHQGENERQDEILSDDQIQALLKEAETRLRGGAASPDESDGQIVSVNPGSGAPVGKRIPRLHSDKALQPYVREIDGVASLDKAKTLPDQVKKLSEEIRTVEKPVSKSKNKEKPTTGPQWFDLPKTKVTPELKRDLQLLRMRSVLDPKRHYKKEGGKAKIPEYSQVGTVVEGPTEFFSGRIARKDRKNTFVEEAMAGEAESRRLKRKYDELQTTKTSGKKAHYKGLQAKRAKKGNRR